MAEQGWYDAGEIKPRDLGANPRCKDCSSGGMRHPAHNGLRCPVRVEGVGQCECDPHHLQWAALVGFLTHVSWPTIAG